MFMKEYVYTINIYIEVKVRKGIDILYHTVDSLKFGQNRKISNSINEYTYMYRAKKISFEHEG